MFDTELHIVAFCGVSTSMSSAKDERRTRLSAVIKPNNTLEVELASKYIMCFI